MAVIPVGDVADHERQGHHRHELDEPDLSAVSIRETDRVAR